MIVRDSVSVWIAIAAIAILLCGSQCARADTALPGGVTCEQVVEYAKMLSIPNTWRGRAQARVIALTFGITITSAQLDAAAKCLRTNGGSK